MTAQPVSFVVLHPQAIAAEALATALGRYPGLMPARTATRASEIPKTQRYDGAVIDRSLPGSGDFARHIQEEGGRVVWIGDGPSPRISETEAVAASVDEVATAFRPEARNPERALSSLTVREREVLRLVAQGLAGKQVAKSLGVSPKTVERHKTRIYAKLGVPNQAAAARLAAIDDNTNGGPGWNRSST